MNRNAEEILFHCILPVPEHCGEQMKLEGNLRLQELAFVCLRCFKHLCVNAKFEYREPKIDAATIDLIDTTP